MKKYTIYAIEKTNGKKIYVGQTTQVVKYRYNKHLVLKKLDPSLHNLVILEETYDKLEAYRLEEYYIAKFNTVEDGLNIAHGVGGKGLVPSKNSGMFTSEGQFKKVRCVETDEVFNSAKECSEKMGLLRSGISMVCNGERNSHRGYTFEFVVSDNHEPSTQEIV